LKAKIEKPNGTKIEIDGSEEEVKRIIEMYSNDSLSQKGNDKEIRTSGSFKNPKGPQNRIEFLITEGYFSEKRNIKDVLNELENRGWIYKQNQISTPLKRLVSKSKLRRNKEEGQWVYFNP
jgi:hypothetical protein